MGLFGFGSKPKVADRYAGKPFLKLIDSFVLKSIGHLEPAQEALLVQMTPKLQQTFGSAGTWDEIVIEQLDFQPSIRESIRGLWDKSQDAARQNGDTLLPMQFVELFVAKNVEDA